jgi:hypothetical protein
MECPREKAWCIQVWMRIDVVCTDSPEVEVMPISVT